MSETLTPARRVRSMDELIVPGDYDGPVNEVNAAGEAIGRAIWFLLPIADADNPRFHDHTSREAWLATQGNGLHRIAEPPWTITEHEDGSVSAEPSIGCGEQPYYWHGFLEPGNVWRQV